MCMFVYVLVCLCMFANGCACVLCLGIYDCEGLYMFTFG